MLLGSAVGGAHDANAHAGHDMAAMAMPMETPQVTPKVTPTVNDSADVAGLVKRFHTAIEQADSVTAISLLTEDAEILESGSVESVADYRAHHLPADIAFAKAIKSTRAPLRVSVRGDIATTTSTSVTKGTFRDRAVDTAGAELIVARRTAQGWRISAIHWSTRRRN